jgi:hypothetical protein
VGCVVGSSELKERRTHKLRDLPVESANHHITTSLHFELDCVEGGLQEMDAATVPGDHQFSIGPFGIFVSADQKFGNSGTGYKPVGEKNF